MGEEGRAVLGIRFSVEASVKDQTLRKMRPKRMEDLEAERPGIRLDRERESLSLPGIKGRLQGYLRNSSCLG